MNNNLKIRQNISLAPLTTFRTGGMAECFVRVKGEGELEEACLEADRRSLLVAILGGGSNVLIADEGVKGLVIKNELTGIEYKEDEDDVYVTAGGGVVWDELVSETVVRGLWGLENLSAIPGTVGATPVQNVGAYGVEVSELIESVRAYNFKEKTFVEFKNNDCLFLYRDSFFKTDEGKNFFVTKVTFKLSKSAQPKLHYKDLQNYFSEKKAIPSLKEIRTAVIDIRSKKFPDLKNVGTAGSFFKNPIVTASVAEELLHKYPNLPVFPVNEVMSKISLGYLLDQVCGLRGYREDNVGLFDNQALVLVNYGGATTDEIKNFAQKISNIVFEKTKIKIKMEVKEI